MSERPVSKNRTPIDRLFAIPVGAEDEFIYDEKPIDFDGDFNQDETYEEEPTVSEDGLDITLETPENLTLVSQTLRRAAGGQQVVDVVYEIDEVDGAIKYEIQVVKI